MCVWEKRRLCLLLKQYSTVWVTLGAPRQTRQTQHKDIALTHHRPLSRDPVAKWEHMTPHLHPALSFFCYHKVKCNIIKNGACTLMSALDHEHLDAQMDEQSAGIHTHRDTRVSGAVLEASQRRFVIQSSLLWQTHRLLTLSLPLSLCSLFFFSLFSSLSNWNVVVAHFHRMCGVSISPCCIGSFSIASVFAPTICCISIVSNGIVPTAVESAVDWRENMMIRKGSGKTTSVKR